MNHEDRAPYIHFLCRSALLLSLEGHTSFLDSHVMIELHKRVCIPCTPGPHRKWAEVKGECLPHSQLCAVVTHDAFVKVDWSLSQEEAKMPCS